MLGLFKKAKINTTHVVDEIEAAVFSRVKPLGFKKHGRTLHRFVSGDISQVIHFQSERGGFLFVNLGIRIPECEENDFHPVAAKTYYHEHECTLRSRLGEVRGKKETRYQLGRKTEKIIQSILDEINRYVLPAFDALQSREDILAHRRDYPLLDTVSDHVILLDECMIHGHLGNLEKAKEAFEAYYRKALEEYNEEMQHGSRFYLKKGERIVSGNQDITAEKNGYVTLYDASRAHLDYLDELRKALGLE